MTAVAAAKTIYAPMTGQVDEYRVVYDFAADAGATGALDLFTAGDANLVITHAHCTVKTACTSGGSATVKWGVTGDDDRFANTTQGAVASLTAGATIIPPALEGTPNVLPMPYKLASGDKCLMTIGTAALTAGKIEFVLRVMKA